MHLYMRCQYARFQIDWKALGYQLNNFSHETVKKYKGIYGENDRIFK